MRCAYIRMVIARLFSLLAMLTLTLAPIAMVAGWDGAQAAPAAAASACHQDEGAPAAPDLPGMDIACAVSCAALPALTPIVVGGPAAPAAIPVAAQWPALSSICAEHETPPPRAGAALTTRS